MKKATAILLFFIFLITNSGMAVSLHWCGGKLASVYFFPNDKHHCPCGKKAMKPGCCKDKTTILKVKNDLVKVNQFVFKIVAPKFNCSLLNKIEITPSQIFQYFVSDFYHPPPYKPKVPIYLFDRVFLI